jgi:tetratricopeptide (TPR) repeat protein
MNSDRARIADAREAIKGGQVDKAAALAAAILREAPTDVDAIEILALVALERNDHAAAETALRTAINVAPERRWPYGDLARLLLKLNRPGDAEVVARAALTADSDNPDAHGMLGSLLAEREQWVDAAAHFERAIAIAGKHQHLLAGLGRALMRQGRLEEARGKLEAAVTAHPSALEPAVFLAEALERLGDLHAAGRQLHRAEAIARRQGTDVDLQRSVLLARMGEHEKALRLLEGKAGLSGAARLQRGRLYERLGKYEEAWDDWVTGKAQLAHRSGRRYDADEVRAQAERVAALVSSPGEALIPARRRGDVPQPIFVVGFPRSGTTLTEQILASHGAIRAGGELPFGPKLHDQFGATGSGGGEADWPERLRDHYLARAGESGLLAPGVAWFTDKMPDNSFWLPLLRLAFPHSPVVRLRRHPLDVLTSVMAHDMTHGFNCGYRLEDAAAHLALVDDLLEHYRLAGFGPTYELNYEALVADQVGETGRLMVAVGLDLEPTQLSFQERSTVSPTPSYAQVREPLNDRSIGRWRRFANQLAPITPLVRDAMNRGAYAG